MIDTNPKGKVSKDTIKVKLPYKNKTKCEKLDRTSSSSSSVGSKPKKDVDRKGGINVVDFETFGRWWQHTIPVCQEDTLGPVLDELGIKHRAQVRSSMAHPISHVCRDEFVIEVLRKEGKDKKRLVLLDWYGNSRNDKFIEKAKTKGLELVIHNVQEYLVQGDSARGFGRVQYDIKHGIECDAIIIQDVYANGKHPLSALQLESILLGAKGLDKKKVYVMFRAFIGQAGSDPVFGENSVEGVWWRDADGKIVFNADMVNGQQATYYAAHDDVNWLLARNVGNIDIRDDRVIGPYRMVSCTSCMTQCHIKLPPVFQPKGSIDYVTLPKLTYSQSLTVSVWNLLAKIKMSPYDMIDYREQVLVHLPIMYSSAHYSYKGMNGYMLDNLYGILTEKFSVDASLQALFRRNPQKYYEIFEGTLLAVMFGTVLNKQDTSLYHRKVALRQEEALQELRNPTLSDTATVSRKSMIAMFVCFMAVLVSGQFYWSFASVFPFLLSPLLEEIGRWYCPLLSFVYIGVEVWINRSLGFGVVPSVLYHLFEWWMGSHLLFALLRHYFFNYVLWNINKRNKSFEVWFDSYCHLRPDVLPKGIYYLPAGFSVPGVEARIPQVSSFLGTLKVKVFGYSMHWKEALLMLRGRVHTNRFYPICWTSAPLWMPANNCYNLLVALVVRMHKEPKNYGVLKKMLKLGKNPWRRVFDLMCPYVPYKMERLISREEAIRDMKSKGRRLSKAWEKKNLGLADEYKKQCLLKHNEVITGVKDGTGIKPRVYVNLDPIYHAETTEYSKNAALFWKKLTHQGLDIPIWGGKNTVRIFYASGCDWAELNRRFQCFLDSPGWAIMMSGDDGIYKTSWGTFGELDLSMADQSQKKECFQGYQLLLMYELGATLQEIRSFSAQVSMPSRYSKDEVKIVSDSGWSLPTGTTATSVFNTNTGLGAFVYAVDRSEGLAGEDIVKNIPQGFAELGLEVKLQSLRNWGDLTFLKGWFRPAMVGCLRQIVWLPLPSQVLKCGKIMSNPLVQGGYEGVAYAISQSYGFLPTNYPILGVLLERLRYLGKENTKVSLDFKYNRIECTERPVLLEPLCLESRYGLSKADVFDCEQLIRKIEHLPCVMSHYVFMRLLDVDYPGDQSLSYANVLDSLIHVNAGLRIKMSAIVPYRRNRGHDVLAALGGLYANPSALVPAVTTVGKAASAAVAVKKVVDMYNSPAGKQIRKLAENVKKETKTKQKKNGGSGGLAQVAAIPAPAAVGSIVVTRTARTKSLAGGGIRIQHSEILESSVRVDTSFAVTAYRINPGLSAVFPWESTIAAQYSEYKLVRCAIRYVPFCATTQTGTVSLAADYNVSEVSPTTEVQMMDLQGAKMGNCWTPMSFNINASLFMAGAKRKYIRTCAVAGDKKTFDGATIYLSTGNASSATYVGKLYIDYTFELFCPRLGPAMYTLPQSTTLLTRSTDFSLSTGVAANITLPTVYDSLNWGDASGAGDYTPPAGCYKFNVSAQLQTTANELTSFEIYLAKNGVMAPTSRSLQYDTGIGTTSLNLSLSLNEVLYFNGTDTCAFVVLATGATGTLKVAYCQAVISLA